ncbi:MAG: spore germination protein [Peptococcaceae bacterium]|nr:spore germination protein [Peptococcaceae bacterium]
MAVSPLFNRLFRRRPPGKPAAQAKNGNRRQDAARPVHSFDELKQIKLSSSLNANLDVLESILGQNDDLVVRRFRLGVAGQAGAAVVYINGMVQTDTINSAILKPLMLESRMAGFASAGGDLLELVRDCALCVSGSSDAPDMGKVVDGVLYGNVALMVDGEDTALIMDMKGWETRGISEPPSEVLVRGPREGFTEALRTNTSMIRRRLRSPNLVLESLNVGRVSHTEVVIAYINGTADPDLVSEVKRRLRRIDIDGVLESGYLEEFIEDSPYSPFPQVLHTERPDRVAAALLEGRVAIFTDGTPFVMIVPATIISFLQSPEDYFERYFLGTAIRLLRYIALASSLLLPSLYIAVTTFHQEMIPTRLLISLAAAREGVPFPALVEAFLMEFTFEALREAGIRLPRAVGQAVSIVGALVIGQAAVQAGVVSPLMVIVVAITGISSFASPVFNLAITMRLLRFPMMLLAGTLGLFGVMAGILIILIHMAGLRSFGAPYLAPLAPFHPGDMKDVAVRAPWWAMRRRPAETGKLNPHRQPPGQKPSPPGREGRGGGQW